MNNFLKKVIAQSPDDLQIISAICAESKVKISDIKYLPSTKIFLLSVLKIFSHVIPNLFLPIILSVSSCLTTLAPHGVFSFALLFFE